MPRIRGSCAGGASEEDEDKDLQLVIKASNFEELAPWSDHASCIGHGDEATRASASYFTCAFLVGVVIAVDSPRSSEKSF
jgi:hypothetical protein